MFSQSKQYTSLTLAPWKHMNKTKNLIIPARDPNSSVLNPAGFSVELFLELSNEFSVELSDEVYVEISVDFSVELTIEPYV